MLRKIWISALMISLVLLTGCGGRARDEQDIEGLRERFRQAENVTFTLELTADDGACVSEYRLRCGRSGGVTEMELLEPELLAGVRARISEKGAFLEYDGLSLGAGDETGVSPMGAPGLLLDALEGGGIGNIRREAFREQKALAFSVDRGNAVEAVFWLEETNLMPIHGEIYENGRMAMCCEFTDWSIGVQTDG